MMKKIFTTLFVLAALTVQAQYLPNGSFDSWKSACGSTEAFGTGSMSSPKTGEMRQRPGVEPSDWNGSSINQKVIMTKSQQLVYNDNNTVKMTNVYIGVGSMGSVAPGFITFGTPWVYASSTINDCDGGTYGGVKFTNKPDAIKGRFRRDDTTGENSHIIVYMWNGTFVSNVGNKNSANQPRNDVDRAILGMTSASQSGTLVAKCDYTFTSTGGGWQEIIVPIEYQNNYAPEMMNVVISGGDYWTRGNMQDGTTLYADDVQFVYYSDLSSLSYDGVDYLRTGQNDYIINKEYDESKLSFVPRGKGASVEKSYNADSKVLTITVKGNDYASNSSNVTVYTVEFKEEEGGGVVEPNPEPEPEPEPTPGEPGDYTPAFTGTKTKGTRWINTVTLSSQEYADESSNTFMIINDGLLCYNDYTASIEMKAAPGETVTLAINDDDATSWMHAYVYIDADNNGFTASIADGSNWQPAGDLVSYSFYNNDSSSDEHGWNSVGASISGDARSTVDLPSFAVPAEPGVYRVRVKMDWCNIDPAGDTDGKFGDFMDNGGQIVDFMLNVCDSAVEPEPEPNPEPEPEPEPTPGDEVDYTPTNTGTRNYAERNINAFIFTSTQYGEVRHDLTANERVSEYLDLTDEVEFVATPGEQVSVGIVTEGSWVNHYIYIDYDADGFTASIEDGSNWQPAEDLVAYSFYNNGGNSDENGWNSEGAMISGDFRSKPSLPTFVVPDAPGVYRLRIKQDWCSIDPAGDSNSNFGGTFSNYGGQIIDVILKVSDLTDIEDVEVESDVKVIYDMQGRRLEEITKPGIYIVNGKKILVK
ncbi:MAG: hypothetical protein J6V47_05080 [Bacteroidaceae bacterium]|nr:hypothetical protein [Bacteroidaceae bacterium]